MDLTKSYPRSVRDKIGGVVMLARTSDKAKALANGNIGEYHFNCPMDQAVFTFLDIDHEAFLAKVKIAASERDIEDFVKLHTELKSPQEIERFNADFLAMKPAPGSDAAASFERLRSSVAPDRTDVTAWADLLDLDEGRAVPRRAVAA
jgi:hypothetical protein